MNKKKINNRIVKSQDGFIEVPTYLFPEAYEHSKEITPEMKVDKEEENEE